VWPDWRQVHNPGFPLLVMVAPPANYPDSNGAVHPADSMDLRARLVFVNRCHDSMAGTGAVCLAAASRIEASVPHRMLERGVGGTDILQIGHPLGVMDVVVAVETDSECEGSRFAKLGFARTARRLMDGVAYVPREPA
jgi:2-methylaconitate cis-trans-isomerase PrpF